MGGGFTHADRPSVGLISANMGSCFRAEKRFRRAQHASADQLDQPIAAGLRYPNIRRSGELGPILILPLFGSRKYGDAVAPEGPYPKVIADRDCQDRKSTRLNSSH